MSPRIYASIGTALVCGLTVLWMACSHLGRQDEPVPPMRSQIALDEEYVDFDELPLSADDADQGQMQASADEDAANSQPMPESGTDNVNSGAPGPTPPVVTQKQQNETQERERQAREAAAAEQHRLEEERIHREVNSQIGDAFDNASGRHNTQAGNGDDGNAGAKGEGHVGTISDSGSNVGKGWSLPRYSAVPSPVTGSVKMEVHFDANGKVTKVNFLSQGSTAPAGTNPAVRQACEAEVRRHTFQRSSSTPATQGSMAIVTYIFK